LATSSSISRNLQEYNCGNDTDKPFKFDKTIDVRDLNILFATSRDRYETKSFTITIFSWLFETTLQRLTVITTTTTTTTTATTTTTTTATTTTTNAAASSSFSRKLLLFFYCFCFILLFEDFSAFFKYYVIYIFNQNFSSERSFFSIIIKKFLSISNL
jgi:hypothetical protein